MITSKSHGYSGNTLWEIVKNETLNLHIWFYKSKSVTTSVLRNTIFPLPLSLCVPPTFHLSLLPSLQHTAVCTASLRRLSNIQLCVLVISPVSPTYSYVYWFSPPSLQHTAVCTGSLPPSLQHTTVCTGSLPPPLSLHLSNIQLCVLVLSPPSLPPSLQHTAVCTGSLPPLSLYLSPLSPSISPTYSCVYWFSPPSLQHTAVCTGSLPPSLQHTTVCTGSLPPLSPSISPTYSCVYWFSPPSLPLSLPPVSLHLSNIQLCVLVLSPLSPSISPTYSFSPPSLPPSLQHTAVCTGSLPPLSLHISNIQLLSPLSPSISPTYSFSPTSLPPSLQHTASLPPLSVNISNIQLLSPLSLSISPTYSCVYWFSPPSLPPSLQHTASLPPLSLHLSNIQLCVLVLQLHQFCFIHGSVYGEPTFDLSLPTITAVRGSLRPTASHVLHRHRRRDRDWVGERESTVADWLEGFLSRLPWEQMEGRHGWFLEEKERTK